MSKQILPKPDLSAQFKNWQKLTPEEQGRLKTLHTFADHEQKTMEGPLVSLSRPGSQGENE